MIRKKDTIKVIFNDSHSNLPSSSHTIQGGVDSFSKKLIKYYFFNKTNNIELVSLLFSHNIINKDIYIKETIDKHHRYYELFYPRENLLESYKKKYTKKEFIKFLKPWLEQLNIIFQTIKPNVVFINGFSLSNWMMLETAYRLKIPVCIQHAGIWKKEIIIAQRHFSNSIIRIFSSLEKEVYKKTSHQIFLNEFSRDVFFKIHNIPKNNKSLSKTSIIPLPIETKNFKKIDLKEKKHYNIGVVARWDRVKNHDAILRFAKYIKKNNLPISLNVVTKWNPNIITKLKTEYPKYIKIINPMQPEKLKDFYKSQDITMIVSRFDVSPTVLMESISCGKPVIISSNVGWISDYNKFGLNKLIINPKASGKIIYQAVKELINNKDEYIKKFTKLQKKIIDKHDTKKIFKQYYKIFKDISK